MTDSFRKLIKGVAQAPAYIIMLPGYAMIALIGIMAVYGSLLMMGIVFLGVAIELLTGFSIVDAIGWGE